jgi:hypothetical protein
VSLGRSGADALFELSAEEAVTRECIAEGLELIMLLLANGGGVVAEPPYGWDPHEWAYVKGLASGELLRLRDRLVPRGTVSDGSET